MSPKLYHTLSDLLRLVADPLHTLAGKCRQQAYMLEQEQGRQAYLATRGDPWVVAGLDYITREGRRVHVIENTEGWLDGLPFIVRVDDYDVYTVDQWGRVLGPIDNIHDLINWSA